MSKWEYKCVPLDRKGTKEDFGFTWTYGPWELGIDSGAKRLLPAGLDELGRQGWELAGVLPSDLWSEGTRSGNASHGVRTISCVLLFKRPAEETSRTSAVPSRAATTPAPSSSAATSSAPSPAANTPAPSSAATIPADEAPAGGTPSDSTAESSPAPGNEPAGEEAAGAVPPGSES